MSAFPPPTNKFFNLVMVAKEKYRRIKSNKTLKDFVAIKDIFPKHTDCKKRVVILIEGVPGIGKSTLCLHICQEWGRRNLFSGYRLVILVQLRDPEIRKASTIADLLPCRDDAMARRYAEEITTLDGKGVLWVLDGWDELPVSLQASSLFCDMINAPAVQKSPIPLSDIIVTSRPISSANLQTIASSRYEILGFTIEQQEEYFKDCFREDGGNAADCQAFLELVRINPVLQTCCCLPQYAAFVYHLHRCGDSAMLMTEYEIFSAVIVNCVHQHFERKCKSSSVDDVDSLDSLSAHKVTKASFDELCKLAYQGILKNKLSFSKGELSNNFCSLGLLHGVESFAKCNKALFQHFNTLSIQEVLAAYYMAKELSEDEQCSQFNTLFHEPRFNAVFKFYAGITKLNSKGIDDILMKIVRENYSPKVVSLIHCLHEAQNDNLCQRLAKELSGVLYLFGMRLHPLDCFAVGYLLSNICISIKVHTGLASVVGEFRVDLDNCRMGDQGCKSLVKSVHQYLKHNCAITSRAILELAGNMLTDEGIVYVAELLSEMDIISKLTLGHTLSGNRIESRGLRLISRALILNKSLTELDLSNCSFHITSENGPTLEEMLKCNSSLKSLLFRNTHMSDAGVLYIANGLTANKAITALRLYNCGITSIGAQYIGNALASNKSLHLLNIAHNQIGGDGAKYIAKGLQHNSSLITCVLDSCELNDTGICSLADAVAVNTTIESLWLEDNLNITNKGMLKLAEVLEKTRSIKKVILPHHLADTIADTEKKVNQRRKLLDLPAIELRGMSLKHAILGCTKLVTNPFFTTVSELSSQRMLVPPDL